MILFCPTSELTMRFAEVEPWVDRKEKEEKRRKKKRKKEKKREKNKG